MNTQKWSKEKEREFNSKYIEFLNSEDRKKDRIFKNIIYPQIKGITYHALKELQIKNKSDWDDLLQECSIKVLTKITIDKVDLNKNVIGYISTTIYNCLKNLIRTRENYRKYHNRLSLFSKANNKPWENGYVTPQEYKDNSSCQFTIMNNERTR